VSSAERNNCDVTVTSQAPALGAFQLLLQTRSACVPIKASENYRSSVDRSELVWSISELAAPAPPGLTPGCRAPATTYAPFKCKHRPFKALIPGAPNANW
jgi:hypothetical protein